MRKKLEIEEKLKKTENKLRSFQDEKELKKLEKLERAKEKEEEIRRA